MLLRARLSSSPCARGIKAIKVVAKEGGKANGEVTIVGVKKRVVFGLVLVAMVVAVCFTLAVNEGKETATPSQTVVTNTVPVPVVISSPAVKVRQRVAAPLPRQIIQGDRRFDTETYCRKVKTLRYIAISNAFGQK